MYLLSMTIAGCNTFNQAKQSHWQCFLCQQAQCSSHLWQLCIAMCSTTLLTVLFQCTSHPWQSCVSVCSTETTRIFIPPALEFLVNRTCGKQIGFRKDVCLLCFAVSMQPLWRVPLFQVEGDYDWAWSQWCYIVHSNSESLSVDCVTEWFPGLSFFYCQRHSVVE